MPKSKNRNLKDSVQNKTNISSQNKDTGLPSYNANDTRPYEQTNMTTGFHKSGIATK
ncbi:MAG: hypothetical protein FWH05_07490 [Oscillospiraceae bacterium]|nr:hypothetical protein [Oscillospiraceae bacterium]